MTATSAMAPPVHIKVILAGRNFAGTSFGFHRHWPPPGVFHLRKAVRPRLEAGIGSGW
jgi:hypothetical protein